jgi:ATP-dependent Clp protease ATP-binding subunit ClpA
METTMISIDRFTKSAQEVPQRAVEIMQSYSHHQMDTEHVLLALIEQSMAPTWMIH